MAEEHRKQHPVQRLAELLERYLSEAPKPKRELQRLARSLGFSDTCLDRAKRRKRVRHTDKRGPGSVTFWSLPGDEYSTEPVEMPIDKSTQLHGNSRTSPAQKPARPSPPSICKQRISSPRKKPLPPAPSIPFGHETRLLRPRRHQRPRVPTGPDAILPHRPLRLRLHHARESAVPGRSASVHRHALRRDLCRRCRAGTRASYEPPAPQSPHTGTRRDSTGGVGTRSRVTRMIARIAVFRSSRSARIPRTGRKAPSGSRSQRRKLTCSIWIAFARSCSPSRPPRSRFSRAPSLIVLRGPLPRTR